MTTRAQRRQAARNPESAVERAKPFAFALIAVGVLTVGAILAFGDFLNRPAAAAGTIDVQSSMAGFTPSEIRVTAGETVTLDWWTQDASMHLENGVHTMIAPELGLYEELQAESRRSVTWQVPDKPGTYDVYCDTCCGGKDSPTMHGKIVVEAA
jgi:plastocyanin